MANFVEMPEAAVPLATDSFAPKSAIGTTDQALLGEWTKSPNVLHSQDLETLNLNATTFSPSGPIEPGDTGLNLAASLPLGQDTLTLTTPLASDPAELVGSMPSQAAGIETDSLLENYTTEVSMPLGTTLTPLMRDSNHDSSTVPPELNLAVEYSSTQTMGQERGMASRMASATSAESGMADPIRVEAEDMTRSQYRVEKSDAASEGEILSLRGKGKGETGTASTTFDGPAGDYDIIVSYFDENDGAAQLQVSHENNVLDTWTLDQQLGSSNTSEGNRVQRTVAQGITLEAGDTIQIKGTEGGEEHARIDYIEFVPRAAAPANDVVSGQSAAEPTLMEMQEVDAPEVTLKQPSKGSKDAAESPAQVLRIEAEDMGRSQYRTEKSNKVSGGEVLSLMGKGKNESGTATTTFNGPSGNYDVVVGYIDENDGKAELQVKHDDAVLDKWTLDQQLGASSISDKNSVRRTVAQGIAIEKGDAFELKGFEKGGEHARIDYIEFVPTDAAGEPGGTPNTPNDPSSPPDGPTPPDNSSPPDGPTNPSDDPDQPEEPPSQPKAPNTPPKSPSNGKSAAYNNKQDVLELFDYAKSKDKTISGMYAGDARIFDPHWWGGSPKGSNIWEQYVGNVAKQTGEMVGVTGFRFTSSGSNREYVDLNQMANLIEQSAWKKGSIPEISDQMINPWTGGDGRDQKVGNFNDLFKPGTQAYDRLHKELDFIAQGLGKLRDRGIPVMFRPFHEDTGGWFWWGSKTLNADQFKQLWEHTHDYMENKKGLDNLIWVYGTSTSNKELIKDRYPGNDLVDIVGVSNYRNDPGDGDAIAAYKIFQQVAPGKPFGFTELGPEKDNGAVNSYNNDLVSTLKTKIPDLAYFLNWYGPRASLALYPNADAVLKSPETLNADDLLALRGGDLPSTPTKPTSPSDKPSDPVVSEPDPIVNPQPSPKPDAPKNPDLPSKPSTPPKSPSRGKLLFEDDFENGLSSGWRREDTAGKSYSLNITDAPGRSGKAARFELHKDDPYVSSSKRSELVGEREPAGAERWYGFSTLLPSDWKSDPAGEIITQWHGSPDKHRGEQTQGGPPLSIHVDGDQMYIKNKWDATPVTSKTSSTKNDAILWSGSYKKGEWNDWVFHVKWSHQSDGLVRVWKDDQLIVDKKGPNTYNDDVGPYMKTGIYKYSWKRNPAQSTTDTRVLYIDNVRVGDSSANYNSVDPT